MTKKIENSNLDAFIEKEMRALGNEYFEELWEEIEDANLDLEVIAQVMIERILQKVVSSDGEETASRLVSHFSERDEMGILAGSRVLQ